MDGFTAVVGLIILVGLIGIVVPLLPGLPLIWAAVLLWASETQTTAGWVVFGTATILALLGLLLQYLLPGRRLAKDGITMSTTLAGAALAFVGFFVIPVVGVFLGFVLGVYLSQRSKLGTHDAAWPSTKQALRAIAMSIGIEFFTGLTIAGTWMIGVFATA